MPSIQRNPVLTDDQQLTDLFGCGVLMQVPQADLISL
jgi:hypothetical protein